MSEKEIKKLQELARKNLEKGVSREEAIRSLQRAGILDKDGKFTSPYQNLGQLVTSREL